MEQALEASKKLNVLLEAGGFSSGRNAGIESLNPGGRFADYRSGAALKLAVDRVQGREFG
jgi:hypothetical protein